MSLGVGPRARHGGAGQGARGPQVGAGAGVGRAVARRVCRAEAAAQPPPQSRVSKERAVKMTSLFHDIANLRPNNRTIQFSRLPKVFIEVGREHEIYQGVGCRVEGREALDEGGYCAHRLVVGQQLIHLEHVENDVRRPAQDED